MLVLIASFVLCTAAIVYSGVNLSKYGDVIAEKTGLGRVWIGLILMATVTSLPELVTGISAVTIAKVPNIAVGDIVGSCVFNLLIIAMIDAGRGDIPISAKAHQGNILAAAFGILLLTITALSLHLRTYIMPLGWIGPYTLFFIPIYLVAVRLIYSYEKKQMLKLLKETISELKYDHITVKRATWKYVINAAVVIVAALFLPGIGKGLAEATGLGQTFVGNAFIAFATSLPEVVVSFSAVRMNAIDLAIGNLFGSNIFNVFILAVDDILFTEGPILSFVGQHHLIAALSAIAMTAVAVMGLIYRAEKKRFFIAWDALVIVMIYLVNLMLLYMTGQSGEPQ